jgi:hypothetical protein
MTVKDLIFILSDLDPDLEIVAGEWVAPSQLGVPSVQVGGDYCHPEPRVRVFAPKPEIWEGDAE